MNRRDFPRVRSDFRERPRNKTERKAGGLRCGARRRREAGGGFTLGEVAFVECVRGRREPVEVTLTGGQFAQSVSGFVCA